MAKDGIRRMALCILADHDARTPGELCSRSVDLTIPQSYELQSEIARLREQRGARVIGYKIGCTSKPIREQPGVSEPIFGRSFDTGCFRFGVRLSYARYANLAVEGELALRLSRDLTGSPTSEEECLDVISAVFSVIELHHYILHQARSPGPELIAGSGMHAGFVLAEELSCSGPPDSVQSICVRINGVCVGAVEGSGTFAGASETPALVGGPARRARSEPWPRARHPHRFPHALVSSRPGQ
jgi:2-keto-4-pentenoate hydratase